MSFISCHRESCERDGEQTNEFLGLLIKLGHILKQDVVNAHAQHHNPKLQHLAHAVYIINARHPLSFTIPVADWGGGSMETPLWAGPSTKKY